MWRVYEHRNLEKKLHGFSIDILKRYEKWKDIVSVSGPEGLRCVKGFHDEALAGIWKGYRSSRLSERCRVIYSIERDEVYVKVIDITSHDYRRR